MAGAFLMDREAMLDLAGTAPMVTDDLPYVEFTAPKSADMSSTAGNYMNITQYAMSVLPYLSEDSSTQLVDSLRVLLEENQARWEAGRAALKKREKERARALQRSN
jgi:hypothetical protein